MKPTYICLGSSGFIGSVFYSRYKKKILLATSSSKSFPNFEKINLLKKNFFELLNNYNPTHLIIFAGETNLDKCYINKRISNKLNYSIPIKIIKYCLSRGITPVVMSSDYVFTGSIKKNHNKIQKPTLHYGKQKLKLERFILKKKLKVLILRISRKKNHSNQVCFYTKMNLKKKHNKNY